MALTLAVLGVPEEAIVDDYARSEAAYRELADRDAMVGALSQVSLHGVGVAGLLKLCQQNGAKNAYM